MEQHKFNEDIIERYLYGYKQIRLASSEEILGTLRKDLKNVKGNLPDTPPLSPRKIRTPEEVSLCTSSLPGCMFGSCAIKRISHGTWFGPLEGKLVRTSEIEESVNKEYMWEIFHDGEVSHFLDGFNENNWMAYVRCARHKKEQNLVIFQYHGCIYYRTTKDISPGSELLVWYDSKYTQLLGIPLAWNDNRNSTSKRKACGNQSEISPNKKRTKLDNIPLLQKLDKKPRKQMSDIHTLIEASKKLDHRDLSLDLSPTIPIRCEKCRFNFRSKDELNFHKCHASSWTPTLRLPSLDQPSLRLSSLNKSPVRLPSIDKLNPYIRPIHINMPYTDPLSYYQNYFQQFSSQYHHYPSPPMDPLKNLPSVAHKGAPIPIKNY